MQKINKNIKKYITQKNYSFDILIISLNQFRIINSVLENSEMNKLRTITIERIGNYIRKDDLLGKLEDEKFIIILENTTNKDIYTISKRIIEHLSTSFNISTRHIISQVNIGMVLLTNGNFYFQILKI